MRKPGYNAPHRDHEDPQGLTKPSAIIKGAWMDPEWAEWCRSGTNAPKQRT